MNYSSAFVLLVFLFVQQMLGAQTVADLEARFNRSGSKPEKMSLAYQIAEKSIASNPRKASDFAVRANQLATEIGDKRKEADAAFLAADAEYRLRNYKEAAGRFNRAWDTARNYGFKDIAISSTEKLQDIALKVNDYKEALKWSTETVRYLRDNSGPGARGGGEAQRKLENQLAAAEADNRSLREQLARATGHTQVLEETYQTQLKDVQEKSQIEISEKSATIDQISKEKQRADSVVRVNNLRLKNLTEEQMIDSIVKAQQERQIQSEKRRAAEYQLAQQQSEAMRNVLLLMVGFVLLLAILFYFRFRAKKRMANELTLKNAQIQEAQKRSDSLLLNILPPAIADELKARNKVAARKYDQATVMFIDFKG
ncbi:MAG: hypothetical protein JNJ57_17965, partial [Saprospiraceae bacterium]|nr:hypothetical protein [Saprospiraceae bacterium]